MTSAKRLASVWAALVCGLAAGAVGAPCRADTPEWRPIETMSLPTDAVGPPSSLTIERSDGPEARVRVTFRRPSGESLPDFFGAGLVPLREGMAADLMASDRLRSDYVFSSSKLDRAPGKRVLILFGGPDPPTMHLMIVGPTTFETYGGGVFFLTRVVHAGPRVELIGRRAPARPAGRCRATYAPYAVLAFEEAKDSSLDYSPGLSRAYNRAHYVWAGPRPRRDLVVDTCGRPRLVRAPAI